MPVPSLITDLDTTPANNSPAGSESAKGTIDDYLRTGFAFIKTLYDTKAALISPSFTTPTLGVATATSINKVVLTTPATSATLTIADGKTLTASNTLTLTGTDGSTLNVGTGGTLGTAAYVNTGTSGATIPLLNGTNTWSGAQAVNANLSVAGLLATTRTSNGAEIQIAQIRNDGTGDQTAAAVGWYLGSTLYVEQIAHYNSGPTFKTDISGSTVTLVTGTGLAVTGTISATDTISTTKTGGTFTATGATTSARYLNFANTTGSVTIGVEQSTGNAIISGSTGYDTSISSAQAIGFSADNGTTRQMLLAATGVLTVCAATATPAAGSTSARLIFGTTAGFGIYYGSGAPTVSAAQGSIYLRSDGSSSSTRLYVNSDGSTTWVNFTSAS